jgi:hypothetical protein
MQTAMTLIHQARATLPWARAWFTRTPVVRRSLRSLAAFVEMLTPRPALVPVRVSRSLLPLALLACMLGTVAPAQAAWQSSPSGWNSTADGNLVDVQVVVNGNQAPLYFRPGGEDRYYFQAYAGRNYALQLRNTTGRRVGVLIAVDGLNVVNGTRSRLGRTEPMYVLDPYETATIRGWRTSLDQVRKFVFVDEQRSYAERTGQANGDMGWIRVLAFKEAGPSIPWIGRTLEQHRQDDGAPRSKDDRDELGAKSGNQPAPTEEGQMRVQKPEAPSRSMAGDTQSENGFPGTGWGDRKNDPVNETWFVAASRPSDQMNFRYEYASGLQALGIPLQRYRLRDREQGELGFAQPPRW